MLMPINLGLISGKDNLFMHSDMFYKEDLHSLIRDIF